MQAVSETDVAAYGIRWSFPPGPDRQGRPDEAQIATCLEFIESRCEPTRTIRERSHSYGLKHAVERWMQEIHNQSVYVSNGAFIVAALRAGYRGVSTGRNCVFNMRVLELPERRIVWLRPPRRYPYLREKRTVTPTRRRRPRWPKHEILFGYVELSRDAIGTERRVFVLHDYDFVSDQKGNVAYCWGGQARSAPIEGVLPESIHLNRPSVYADPELRVRPRPIPSWIWPPA